MYSNMFDDAWKVFVPMAIIVGGTLVGIGIGIGYLIWG